MSSWKSEGLSGETIAPYATSDNSLTPWIDNYGTKIRLKLNKSCLKQSNTLTYDKGHIVNIYIVYELGAFGSNDSDPTLFYLVQLLYQKMQILKNMDILVLVLNSIEVFHFQVLDFVKMY